MSISNTPCDGASPAVDDVKAEDCSYWHIVARRTLVGADCFCLQGDRVFRWPRDGIIYMRQDGRDGRDFDINQFTFVEKSGRGRSVICNSIGWCAACRRFHQQEGYGKWDDRLWQLMRGYDGFIENCHSLFEDYRHNPGWVQHRCPQCERQAKDGYVYVAVTNGAVKIGVSKSSPDGRMKGLQTGCPWPIRLHWSMKCDDMRAVESVAHRTLNRHRMSGEWFGVEPDKAVDVVMKACKQ